MADDDRERPSLELPSLGLGRKRKRTQPAAESEPAAASEPPPAPPVRSRPEPQEPAPEPEQPARRREEGAAPAEPAPIPAAHPVPPTGEPQPSTERAAVAEADGSDRQSPGRRFTPPAVSGQVAAVVAGVLVGLVSVGLVWGSTRLCEVVRGTSSCGAPGAVLLLAVVVLAVLLGRVLLDALGAPEPLSTSVLGVGIATVVTLLFLGGDLLEWWMVIAVPVVAALSYVLAHAVTTTVVGPIEDNMHR